MESTLDSPVTLVDAVSLYLNSLKKKKEDYQQHQLMRFAQWAGGNRLLTDLKPSDIDQFGQDTMGMGGGEKAIERLHEVKLFLAFARKKGFIEVNLAQHLRVPRTSTKSKSASNRRKANKIVLSPEAYIQLTKEMKAKQAQREPIAQEIRRAAADKDVRENAPLEAAREQLGLVESRIREIERTLETAVAIDPSTRVGKTVRIGSKVTLKDLQSGRQVKYTVVSALEANPRENKISDASPVGHALIEKASGDKIEVVTPRGVQHYQLVRVY